MKYELYKNRSVPLGTLLLGWSRLAPPELRGRDRAGHVFTETGISRVNVTVAQYMKQPKSSVLFLQSNVLILQKLSTRFTLKCHYFT